MTDYETIQKKRNITVGLFVVVGIAALIWLVFVFGDMPVFVSQWKSFEVRVQFPTAPGVRENTPVRFCGYQIGRVVDVQPPKILRNTKINQWSYQTLVVIRIDKQYDNVIPDDVEVKLMMRGLGSSYIEFKVEPFDVQEPQGPFLAPRSLLQGSTGMTSEFFPEESQKKLEELANGLNTLITNFNDILGDPNNKENIKTSLANLAEATNEAIGTLKEFKQVALASGTTLRNADTRITELSAAVVNTSEELSKAVAELRLILIKINHGKGTAAMLVNDGRLYENLLENSQQLDVFLKDLTLFIAEVNEKGFRIKW